MRVQAKQGQKVINYRSWVMGTWEFFVLLSTFMYGHTFSNRKFLKTFSNICM